MRIRLKVLLILFITVTPGCHTINNKKITMSTYSTEDILRDLNDAYASDPFKFFPSLDDGYLYISSNRINLFADKNRWAIVFERTGYHNRVLMTQVVITYFGNCLKNLDKTGLDNKYTSNVKWFPIIEEEDFNKIEKGFELVSPEVTTIKVRNTFLPLDHNPERYKAKGININNYENPDSLIDFPALVRFLDEENPELFRATEEELRTCIPNDLPKLMTIDEWFHKDYLESLPFHSIDENSKPSAYETFQMIADVLVSKDPSKWKPTLKPNSNWRNWNSGNL